MNAKLHMVLIIQILFPLPWFPLDRECRESVHAPQCFDDDAFGYLERVTVSAAPYTCSHFGTLTFRAPHRDHIVRVSDVWRVVLWCVWKREGGGRKGRGGKKHIFKKKKSENGI